MLNVYFDCRPNGTQVWYVPLDDVKQKPLVEVKTEPPEIDDINDVNSTTEPMATVKLEPMATVKLEPEFVEIGMNASGIDFECEEPVDNKPETLKYIYLERTEPKVARETAKKYVFVIV